MSATSCCSPASRGPCRSCWAASCSPPTSPGRERLYGIVAVVVVFSVVVQGSLVPAAARLLRVQMRPVEPEPWALGVRLRDEPSDVHRLTIRAGVARRRPHRRRPRRPSRQCLGQLHRSRWPASAHQGRHPTAVRGRRAGTRRSSPARQADHGLRRSAATLTPAADCRVLRQCVAPPRSTGAAVQRGLARYPTVQGVAD